MIRLFKRIGLVAVVLFVLVEIILHVFLYQKLRIRHFPDVYQVDTVIGYKYRANASDYRIVPAYYLDSFKINSHGLHDIECTLEKDSGDYRMVFFDFSTGVDTDGANYVRQLRTRLINNGFDRVDIINGSMDGGERDLQRIAFLKSKLMKFNPDLLFFEISLPLQSLVVYRTAYKDYTIFFHDLAKLSDIQEYIDATHYQPSLLKSLFQVSFTFRYVCKYYSENDNTITEILSKVWLLRDKKRITEMVKRVVDYKNSALIQYLNISQSIEQLQELYKYTNENNCRLVIYDAKTNSSIKKYFIEQIGGEYLGLTPQFNETSTFGVLDEHPTEEGFGIIADSMYSALLRTDFIPAKYKPESVKSRHTSHTDSKRITIRDLGIDSILNATKHMVTSSSVFNILVVNNKIGNSDDYRNESVHSQSVEILHKSLQTKRLENTIHRKNLPVNSLREMLKEASIEVGKCQADIVVMPLYLEQLKQDTKEAIELIVGFKNELEKHNIGLLCTYVFDDDNVFDESTTEKIIIDYLLKQQNVICSHTRVNVQSYTIPGEITKPEHRLNQRIYTEAHTLLDGINNCLISRNVIPDTINLAYNKPVSVSSSLEKMGFYKVAVGDNANKSFYSWSYGWLSDSLTSQNHEEWVSIDLLDRCNIDRIIIYPVALEEMPSYGFPLDFQIQYSTNGREWTTIEDLKDYPLPKYEEAQIFNFTPVTARYIRVYGTKLRKNMYPEGELYRMAFAEVEVYGPIDFSF